MNEHRLCGAHASKLKQGSNQLKKQRPLWDDDVKTKSLGYFDKSLSKTSIFQSLSSHAQHNSDNMSIWNSTTASRTFKNAKNTRKAARKKTQNKAKKDFIMRNIERVTGSTVRERQLIERRKAKKSVFTRPIHSISSPRSRNYNADAHKKASKIPQKMAGIHFDAEETSREQSRQIEANDWNQSITFAARVFVELDQDRRNEIGIEQIIQGLRLLGLPATHNQVADYVYLIHEGESDCINEEEWEILVSTLDAASVHSVYPSQNFSAVSSTSTAPVVSQPKSSHPRTMRPTSPTMRTKKASMNSLKPTATTNIDPSFIENLHVKVDEMVKQACQGAYVRWNPSTASNNQQEAQLNPEKALNRAVTIMSGLKSTFYPLVHQAEETLKELRKKHGAKLSLVVPARDLRSISTHSEALSFSILDDLLLDTIDCLNEIERHKTQRRIQSDSLQQIAAISDRVERMEKEETEAKKLVKILAEPLETAIASTQPSTILPSEDDSITVIDSPLRRRIEKQQKDFAFHRKLVEASLESTGMSQSCVVEFMEDLILEDLLTEAATELENNVDILADAITTLL